MENNLEELLLDIQTSPSQVERAKAELRYIETISTGTLREKILQLSALSNESATHITLRLRILQSNAFSDIMWPLIESGQYTLNLAVTKLRELESKAKEKSVVKETILEEIVVTQERKDSIILYEHSVKKKKSTLKKAEKLNKVKNVSGLSIKKELSIFSSSLRKKIRKNYPNLPDYEIDYMLGELESDLRISVSILKRYASRRMEIGDHIWELDKKKTRKIVIESCDLLGVERPKPGKLVDLSLARKNLRVKCKPFISSGDEEQYKDFVVAFNNLTEYNNIIDGDKTP